MEQNETQELEMLERSAAMELRVMINALSQISAMPITADRYRLKALDLVDQMEEEASCK